MFGLHPIIRRVQTVNGRRVEDVLRWEAIRGRVRSSFSPLDGDTITIESRWPTLTAQAARQLRKAKKEHPRYFNEQDFWNNDLSFELLSQRTAGGVRYRISTGGRHEVKRTPLHELTPARLQEWELWVERQARPRGRFVHIASVLDLGAAKAAAEADVTGHGA